MANSAFVSCSTFSFLRINTHGGIYGKNYEHRAKDENHSLRYI